MVPVICIDSKTQYFWDLISCVDYTILPHSCVMPGLHSVQFPGGPMHHELRRPRRLSGSGDIVQSHSSLTLDRAAHATLICCRTMERAIFKFWSNTWTKMKRNLPTSPAHESARHVSFDWR